MKLGIFYPAKLPFSIRAYTDNIIHELVKFHVEIICFSEHDPLPKGADLYWDPRSTGGIAPCKLFKVSSKPYVVTVHGVAPLALPAREYFRSLKNAVKGKIRNSKNLADWRAFRKNIAAVITVSNISKAEIEQYLKIYSERIIPIYHGVDHNTFQINNKNRIDEQPYLLHISQYQPKKNIDRIIAAYARVVMVNKPRLIMVASGYPEIDVPMGVEIHREPVTENQLIKLYKGATGFLFPSLHEGFGMPILEAMACGCPVITSRNTACADTLHEVLVVVDRVGRFFGHAPLHDSGTGDQALRTARKRR